MTAPSMPPLSASELAEPPRGKRVLRFVLLGLAAAAIGALVLTAVIVHDSNPTQTAWPVKASGRPWGLGQVNVPASQVNATAAPGAYAWSDFDGWHLWLVNPPSGGTLRGTIQSDAPFDKAALAIAGAGHVTQDGKTITFVLPAAPHLVGVDFSPGFFTKRLTFTVARADGSAASGGFTIARVRHRSTAPVTIEKVKASKTKKR